MRQYAYFGELPPKTHFGHNGNQGVKMSTRTAEYPDYSRRFYFSKTDLVAVGLHSRLRADYFKKGE